MKALHFVKTSPIFDPAARYYLTHNVQISKTGVQFKEDLELPKQLKERIANSRLIRELSEKFDTFVQLSVMPSMFKWHKQVAYLHIWHNNPARCKSEQQHIVGYAVNETDALEEMFKKLQ